MVEKLPTVLFPKNGALVSDYEPILDWTDVSDEQSEIAYSISVYNHDTGEAIWQNFNISESQARFNSDGNAKESLQEGMSYDLEVSAFDTFTNSSYEFITFTIGDYKYLENDLLLIKFHPTFPKVDQYTLKSNNKIIYGDITGEMFSARMFYKKEFYDIEPSLDSISQTSNQICYHMRVDLDVVTVVTFDLSYLLENNAVELTFRNIIEKQDCHLIYVQSPDLMTIRGTQPGAKLVLPYAEGRLIDISTSDPGYMDLEANGWLMPLLMGMLYYDGLAGIVSYDHLDILPWERIYDNPFEGRLCSIGIKFNYRYPPTNFSSAAFIDVFDSKTSELSLKLTFISDYDGDEDIDWIDGAKILRDQVKAVPDKRYLSSFITKIGANGIPHISDHLKNIRKLYNLTDHNRIYSYLLSFGSPGIFSVFGVEEDLNPHFATLDELKEVFQTAENLYNTILSFHDNYTDYFPKQPTYYSDLRVTLEDGTPAGESPSDIYPYGLFLVDPYDYALQEGLDRVKRTVERYPIKETYHIDVLGLIVPKDYSTESPSSRERNRRGIQLIIDEFAKSGINITAESITGYFVESGIGWFLDTPRILTNFHPFSNSEIIPFIEFIYHGKTLYGLYPDIYPADVSLEEVEVYTTLEPLLLGANSASHITYTEPNDLEINKFFLIDLPWMALNQRFMEDYEVNGSYRKVTYDADTFVEIDYESDTYTVQVDGRVIAQDYKTVYQKDENTILVFSRDQQRISELLPDGWDKNIKLQKLTEGGYEDNISFEYSDRKIIFYAEANTPYKIIRIQASNDSSTDNGYKVTSELWTKAVLQVPGNPVTLVWKLLGTDITPTGDQVISGYFYADPKDFAYGSEFNPELFVKIYIAKNGWCNIAFNHVTVDYVSVYSMSGGESQSSTATLNTRLVEHQYNGVSIDSSLQITGETINTSSNQGYILSSGLWAKAVLQPSTGAVNLIWKAVGTDITPSGDTVISGYFYADLNDFAYGSVYNPEIFVKVYISKNGWCNIAYNHVTVDDVTIYSAHNYDGVADQTGSTTLSNRLVEHQYNGVSLQ